MRYIVGGFHLLLDMLSSVVHNHLTRNSYSRNLAQWKRIFCVCIVISQRTPEAGKKGMKTNTQQSGGGGADL